MRRLFSCLLIPALGTNLLLADGMMTIREVGQSTSIVNSPKQEALLVYDKHKQTVTVTLRTHFRSGPTDLAWVIPVPKKPNNIKARSNNVFRKLEEWTTPRFEIFHRKKGFGCSCGGGGLEQIQPGVEVMETGTAGIFDFVTLTATKVDALTKWLNDNQYRVPRNAEKVIQRYVDSGWYWLAIRVQAKLQSKSTLTPHPISYSYQSSELVYPLVISSLSADKYVEVVLYVLADSAYGCENWANDTIHDYDDLKIDVTSPSGTNYEKLFHQLTKNYHGYLFVPEYAIEYNTVGYRPRLELLHSFKDKTQLDMLAEWQIPKFLTRLRAVVAKENLDRDVILKPTTKYTWISNSYRIRNQPVPHIRHDSTTVDAIIGTILTIGVFLFLFIILWTKRVPK